jgi:hypothetical protein
MSRRQHDCLEPRRADGGRAGLGIVRLDLHTLGAPLWPVSRSLQGRKRRRPAR